MATITTKFDKDQEVYFIENNKVCRDHIDFVDISLGQWKNNKDEYPPYIKYALRHINKGRDRHNPLLYGEDRLFATKEALLEALKEQTPALA